MLINDKEYLDVLANIKARIRQAQHKAVFSVNKEMLLAYYDIGAMINAKASWGSKFAENLSRDILLDFPKIKGFSRRNLLYMAQMASVYPDKQFVQRVVAQIPWRTNIAVLDKIKDVKQREWYLQKTLQNGWSQPVLIHQIETDLFQRQVLTNKTDNFKNTLPSPQSDLVQQSTKDPYIFDFVSNAEDIYELQLEKALVDNITRLLLELGTGFAFLGNQYHKKKKIIKQ